MRRSRPPRTRSADGCVASVQNGVGNEETIAAHVERVIRGTTFPAGKILEPGVVQWDVKGDTTFGPFEPQPAAAEAIEQLADACTRGGMPSQAVADARGAQWRKVIFNASTNPVGALTGLTHGRVCEQPELRAFVTGLVDEGKAVAAAQGIELDADPEELIDHAARPEVAYGHKASMLQDVEARRQTEVDYLNGGIVRFGREHGVRDPAQRGRRGPDQGNGAFVDSELERRHANVRAAMAEHELDALDRRGQRVQRLRGVGHLPLGLPGRPSLRLRRRPGRRRAADRLPERGALRRRARDGAARAGLPRPPRRAPRGDRARPGLEPDRRLRARLRDDGPRLPGARELRARPVRRRVRSRPRRQERGRARVRARERADQRGRVRGVPRRLRAGEDRRRGRWRPRRSSSSSAAAGG